MADNEVSMAQRKERYSPDNTRILAFPRRADHREQNDHQRKSNTDPCTSTTRDIKRSTYSTPRNRKDQPTRKDLYILAKNTQRHTRPDRRMQLMPDAPKKADPRSIRQQKITKRTMGGDCSRPVRAQKRKLPASRRHLHQISNPKETKKHSQQ